jgi:hypothetical protein
VAQNQLEDGSLVRITSFPSDSSNARSNQDSAQWLFDIEAEAGDTPL